MKKIADRKIEHGFQDHPLGRLSGAWHHQRRFIFNVIGFLMLPVFFLILFSCYSEGRYREYGPVTITLEQQFLDGHGSRNEGGGRWSGGYTPATYSWKHAIWGKTRNNEICFIDIKDQESILSLPYFPYKTGDILKTHYTVHKKSGDFRWTLEASFWLNTGLVILFVMVIILLCKESCLLTEKS